MIEHIGPKVWDGCLESLAKGGRLITCGATTGGDVKLNLRYVFSRQLTIKGSYMGTRAKLVKAADLGNRPDVSVTRSTRGTRTDVESKVLR